MTISWGTSIAITIVQLILLMSGNEYKIMVMVMMKIQETHHSQPFRSTAKHDVDKDDLPTFWSIKNITVPSGIVLGSCLHSTGITAVVGFSQTKTANQLTSCCNQDKTVLLKAASETLPIFESKSAKFPEF